jgi:hypothetical protein
VAHPQQDYTNQPGDDEERSWSIFKVLDITALVLVAAVLASAVGGVVAALGVPTVHFNLGGTTGSSVSLGTNPPLTTYQRLFYGTLWAGLATGLALLASLALVALPRIVGDAQPGHVWPRGGFRLLVAIGLLACAALVANVVAIVNVISYMPAPNASGEALDTAAEAAAGVVAALVAVLSWFSRPFVVSSGRGDRSTPR